MIKTNRIGIVSFLLIILMSANSLYCLAEKMESIQKITLDQAVKIALDSSIKRQLAKDEVDTAQAKLGQAYSGYFPKITLSGGVAQFDEIPSSVQLANSLIDLNNALDTWAGYMALFETEPHQKAFLQNLSDGLSQKKKYDEGLTYTSIKLRLEQPLYTGGKLTAVNRQAQANIDYAKANLETAEQNLVLEVKKSYFTVLQMQHLLETMNEAVKSMENHCREAKLYFEAGQVPQLDVLRAEVKLADLQQKQLSVQNGLLLSQRYFNFVLGVDQNTQYQLEDREDYASLTRSIEACKKIAMTNRTELKALKIQQMMVQDNVIIAKSGKKPLVALVAQGEHIEPVASDPEITLSLVATLNISDGGMVKNQVAEAELRLRQIENAQNLMVQGISLEVEQAYQNIENSLKAIEVSGKALKQSEETVRMAEVSYQAGLGTSLERIDAEVGLTQAKNNYYQAVNNYYIALAQLEKALGVTEEELLK